MQLNITYPNLCYQIRFILEVLEVMLSLVELLSDISSREICGGISQLSTSRRQAVF